MNKQILLDYVIQHLQQNELLTKLLALGISSVTDDIPFPENKLVGEDWEGARAGQKVKVTWVDPYRIDEGYLFLLPGLEAQNIYLGGFVHIPSTYNDKTEQAWYSLKHLAILADQIELQPEI